MKITYLKLGRFRDKNDVLHVFVASVSIFWSLKSGVQRFIPLIALEAPTALVPGASEPRIYPRSGQISSIIDLQDIKTSFLDVDFHANMSLILYTPF